MENISQSPPSPPSPPKASEKRGALFREAEKRREGEREEGGGAEQADDGGMGREKGDSRGRKGAREARTQA